jgi:hypothetical protein
MTPLFKDPAAQHEFDSKGYVVIPFLSRSEVAELAAFYSSLQFESAVPRLSSVITERPMLARQIRQEFNRIAADAIDRHFASCDLILGNFLVKRPNPEGVTPPHQDWTMVDEARVSAGVAWVAVADVDLENGAMGVLPGSRSLFSDVRCAPSAFAYRLLPYAAYAMDLFPYLDFRVLEAGEALVFGAGGVHGSLPNKTQSPRVAATFSLAPRGTQFSLPYLLPHTDLSKFESFEFGVDDFVEYDNSRLTDLYERGTRPSDLKSLGVFDFRPKRIGADEAIRWIEEAGCRKRTDLP